MLTTARSRNSFLSSLCADDYEAVRPHLRTIKMEEQAVLATTGDKLALVYFPLSGMISLVVHLVDCGNMIEVAMVGCESLVGASEAQTGMNSASDMIVQIPGAASVIDVARFRVIVEQSATLRAVLVRHERLRLVQAQQSAACNAYHSVESRLSRWLLRVRDIVGSNSFFLTQEFLAQMIGARRNRVSLVAGALQQAGVITSRRGNIEITDVEGLKECSCECYEAVKAHFARVLNDK